jgi:hypothetical protein
MILEETINHVGDNNIPYMCPIFDFLSMTSSFDSLDMKDQCRLVTAVARSSFLKNKQGYRAYHEVGILMNLVGKELDVARKDVFEKPDRFSLETIAHQIDDRYQRFKMGS